MAAVSRSTLAVRSSGSSSAADSDAQAWGPTGAPRFLFKAGNTDRHTKRASPGHLPAVGSARCRSRTAPAAERWSGGVFSNIRSKMNPGGSDSDHASDSCLWLWRWSGLQGLLSIRRAPQRPREGQNKELRLESEPCSPTADLLAARATPCGGALPKARSLCAPGRALLNRSCGGVNVRVRKRVARTEFAGVGRGGPAQMRFERVRPSGMRPSGNLAPKRPPRCAQVCGAPCGPRLEDRVRRKRQRQRRRLGVACGKAGGRDAGHCNGRPGRALGHGQA